MHSKILDAAPRLLLHFLEWVADRPRNYGETMGEETPTGAGEHWPATITLAQI
jgi:hypothetical protein